jgi:hypothetical protein
MKMNKLLLALLVVSSSAMAQNTVLEDLVRGYNAQQPAYLYQPPPVYVAPQGYNYNYNQINQGNPNVGNSYNGTDFGNARLRETQPINLGR